MPASICLLTVWAGPLPRWMPQLIQNRNGISPDIKWLILGENLPREDHGQVQFHPLSLGEFKSRVRETIGVNIPVSEKDKRKITDVRPALGEIFQDYLEGQTFWGYADLDVVFGRIPRFWTDAMLRVFDVLTTDVWVTCGPLTLVRNTEHTNKLWRNAPNIVTKIEAPDFCCHDEYVFGRTVWDAHMAGSICAMFGPRMSHDREHSKVSYDPTTGILYDQVKGNIMSSSYPRQDPTCHGREVIGYHFVGTKRWPF